jgi:hypothetical protein
VTYRLKHRLKAAAAFGLCFSFGIQPSFVSAGASLTPEQALNLVASQDAYISFVEGILYSNGYPLGTMQEGAYKGTANASGFTQSFNGTLAGQPLTFATQGSLSGGAGSNLVETVTSDGAFGSEIVSSAGTFTAIWDSSAGTWTSAEYMETGQDPWLLFIAAAVILLVFTMSSADDSDVSTPPSPPPTPPPAMFKSSVFIDWDPQIPTTIDTTVNGSPFAVSTYDLRTGAITPIPELPTWGITLLGFAGLGLFGRRRSNIRWCRFARA